MNARFEAIFSKDALGSCEALNLGLNHELTLEVRAKLSTHCKSLLCCKGHSAQGDRDHIFVDQLGRLVLM